MNTTEIGNKFEDKCLHILEKLVEDEQIYPLRDHIKIRRKPKYFSKDRNDNITFDLSIEVWPPNAERFTLLYVVECKAYSKRVPVDEIETFCFQLQQLGTYHIKGIFISNAPLQKGGDTIVKNKGIMLVQGESADDFKIVYHKKKNIETNLELPFLVRKGTEAKLEQGVDLISKLIDEAIRNSLLEISTNDDVGFGIDKLSKKEIQKAAENELERINPELIGNAKPLKIDEFRDYLTKECSLSLSTLEESDNRLGTCNIHEGEILLHKSIIGTQRELFILAHEFGHFILHQKLRIGQTQYDLFEDAKRNFRSGTFDLSNPKNWIEYQANIFAAGMVLPYSSVRTRLWLFQDFHTKSRGKILLNADVKNQEFYRKSIIHLSTYFNVSKTSVIYNLDQQELVNDQIGIKSIGQIIDEFDVQHIL